MTLAEKWRALRGDGCTSAPDFQYAECCRDHDRYYYFHSDALGRPITRKQADEFLRECMRRKSKTPIGAWFISNLYYYAVRVFGGKYWKKEYG